MFSLGHELYELFPDTTFTTSMTHKLRGVMQHKISVTISHLHELILVSLHSVNSQNHSTEPYVPPMLTSNEMFSTYIPTSLLNEVLLLMKIPTISSDAARTLMLKKIESAFLDVNHINVTTLSWLLWAYFRAHKLLARCNT